MHCRTPSDLEFLVIITYSLAALITGNSPILLVPAKGLNHNDNAPNFPQREDPCHPIGGLQMDVIQRNETNRPFQE